VSFAVRHRRMIKMATYDLTTRSGYDEAGKWLKKYGWIIAPVPWLIYKLFSTEVSTENKLKWP